LPTTSVFEKQIGEIAILRLLNERDAPAIFEVVDRERDHLRPWLPWVNSTTKVEHTRQFIRSSRAQFAANDGLAAGIWCQEEFAGTVGTHKINWPYRKVEIGYWIASKFQGRGVITEACRALIDHAFQVWELHRVEIHCATVNEKSRRVAERLGFRLEAVLREAALAGGEYADANVYGMLAGEWKARPR
jgi:ribosomal-protein-serine acetyltransferase